MKCKTCGNETHYCTKCSDDCSLGSYMDLGYCCSECYGISKEGSEMQTVIKKFAKSLKKNQLLMFEWIVENYDNNINEETVFDAINENLNQK